MKLFGSKNEIYEPLSGAGDLLFVSRSRLARAIAAVSGLTVSAISSIAFGLGLGDMQAKSYLGQPLIAEIDLVSLDRNFDLETLIVRQVPAAEAEQMGVNVSPSSYRFDVKVDTGSASPKVAIASATSINEPYLSLLIELRWPAGVVYREYPVLLDPPPTVSVAATSPRPSVQQQRPAVASQGRATSGPTSAPARMDLPALRTSEGKYQVQAGDSLSKIAERWREGTSQGIDETMQWLHANNAHAFARGDIDQLLAGAVLQMPDLAAYKLSPSRSGQAESGAQASDSPSPSRAAIAEVAPSAENITAANTVGRDAAQVGGRSGLLTVGAITRDDKTREMIDLLVRENESLKERVEKLESSEYLDTLKQLIVLQRQQISELRSELGVSDSAFTEEMDTLLAQVGVSPGQQTPIEVAPESTAQDAQSSAAEVDAEQVAEVDAEPVNEVALVNLDSSARPAIARAEEDKSGFLWFVIGAGVLLAALFAAMYAYYRKLVPVREVDEEYSDLLAPDDEAERFDEPRFVAVEPRQDDNFILYDGAPQPAYKPKKGQGNDDWMGEKASSLDLDATHQDFDVDEIQKSFADISLDEDALTNFDGITETSLEAITKEMPKETATESVGVAESSSTKVKGKPSRRPDDEVKMSIAEKMSQYNPEEYRQELESLGFLELDELVDLNDSNEDEVEAIVYRAMMFCEFKKFDKAIDLIESKMELITDDRLGQALIEVRTIQGESVASKKIG